MFLRSGKFYLSNVLNSFHCEDTTLHAEAPDYNSVTYSHSDQVTMPHDFTKVQHPQPWRLECLSVGQCSCWNVLFREETNYSTGIEKSS